MGIKDQLDAAMAIIHKLGAKVNTSGMERRIKM
jgi:hypothetical protein